jgi:hypothetical protein
LYINIASETYSNGFIAGSDSDGNAITGTVSGSSIDFNENPYFGGYEGWLGFSGGITANGAMCGGQGCPGGLTVDNGHGLWGGWWWTVSGQAVQLAAPTFTLQPVGQVISAGQPVAFSASATGYPAPTYQWQFDGTNIANATNSNYSLSSTGITNLGLYDVVASNSVGTNVSNTASLSFLNMQCFPGLVLYGPVGQNYTIEEASIGNLTNWTPVTNITLGINQPYVFVDYSSVTNIGAVFVAVPQPQ